MLRLLLIISHSMLVSNLGFAVTNADSGCKPTDYRFTTLQWVSGVTNAVAADEKIRQLIRTEQSTTQAQIKRCCSQTAKSEPVKMSCHIRQIPIGEKHHSQQIAHLCAQPQISFIVGYGWRCVEPERSTNK